MKEIIKKIVVGILAVGIVIGAAVYRFVLYDPDKGETTTTQPIVTDAEGTTYYAVTNPDGSMMVIVTNENGEQFKAEYDGQNVVGTTVPVSAGEVEGTLPSNYTGPHINVVSTSSETPVTVTTTTNPSTTKADAPQNSAGATTTTTTKAPAQQTTTKAPVQVVPETTGNKIDVYLEVFALGNFLMEVNDPDLGPVTMAMKGNKMYLNASMEGITLKLIYDGDKKDAENPDGTWYLMIDSLKKYAIMPADMLGDMNVEELTSGFTQDEKDLVYTSEVVDVDGALLVCESTTDSNGNTLKYYFDGDVLVRSDTVSRNGSVSITKFSKITTDVPDSLFTIPSNYSKLNLDWLLENLAGEQ